MNKLWKHTICYLIIIVASIFYFFPVYWLVLTSLKCPGEITSYPPVFLPSDFSIDNYRLVLGYEGSLWGEKEYIGRTFLAPIIPYLKNSLVIGISSSAIALFLGVFLAYGIVKFKVGRKNLYTWFLSLRMIPPVVVAIPLFIIFRTVRLIDTFPSLIIAYLLMNIPFATVVLVGFLKDIPQELSDAAVVDGCTSIGAFFRIILPLAAPGLVAVFIIAFLFCWNELLIANVLTTSEAAQTFPVYTTQFAQVERGTAWGAASAGGVISIIPLLVFVSYIQKYLSRGLTMGAVR